MFRVMHLNYFLKPCLIGQLHNFYANPFSTNSILKKQRKTHAGDLLLHKFLSRRHDRSARGASARTTHIPGSGVGTQFRIVRLNKIFLHKITDILSCSRLGNDILEYKVSISKVELALDLSQVHVYWWSNHENFNQKLEKNIKIFASSLRHELQNLKIMGVVPRIVFHRENKNEELDKLDKLMAVADFGEDYEPTDPSFYQKSEYILKKQFDDNLWEKILELAEPKSPQDINIEPIQEDSEDEPSTTDYINELGEETPSKMLYPCMENTNNHVHWERMMDKIMCGINLSKATHRFDYMFDQPTRPAFENKRASAPPAQGTRKCLKQIGKMQFRRDEQKKSHKIIEDQLLHLDNEKYLQNQDKFMEINLKEIEENEEM